MKTYTTGQVAKICGITSAKARKLLDGDGVEVEFIESKYQRRSTRRIHLKNLIRLMIEHGFSFDGFDADDADAQKAILCHYFVKLRKKITGAKKRGDIFIKIGLSSDVLEELLKHLGSFDNMRGTVRNHLWAGAFRAMADILEQHARVCKANFKR